MSPQIKKKDALTIHFMTIESTLDINHNAPFYFQHNHKHTFEFSHNKKMGEKKKDTKM
jgi:hypothetical protein